MRIEFKTTLVGGKKQMTGTLFGPQGNELFTMGTTLKSPEHVTEVHIAAAILDQLESYVGELRGLLVDQGMLSAVQAIKPRRKDVK